MEIYRDSAGSATFTHPYTGITSVDVYDDAALSADPVNTKPLNATPIVPTQDPTTNVWTAAMPWSLTQYDRTLRIKWYDGLIPQFVRWTALDVVSPVVSLSAIKSLAAYATATDAEAAAVESKVRLAVNSYTGQNFGYYEGTKVILGSGEPYLKLPQRLVEFDSVAGNGLAAATTYTMSGDGWFLTAPDYSVFGTKDAPPEEFQVFNQQTTDGVIRVPSAFSAFGGSMAYTVSGKWGYLEVPSAVSEAALLLADDYAAMDVTYRDRYLTNVSATDWILEYNPLTYTGTGNARADALLSAYRVNRMEII